MGFLGLLISDRSANNLDEMAKKVFDAIGTTNYEQRYSDHEVGGTYFLSSCSGKETKVGYSDSDESDSFPYWILISDQNQGSDDLEGQVREILKSMLVDEGVKVALIRLFGSADEHSEILELM
jgi:hypothetical protein